MTLKKLMNYKTEVTDEFDEFDETGNEEYLPNESN